MENSLNFSRQKYAASRGWTVFAVQNDNECFTAADAVDTFMKYGVSTRCSADGRGGPHAQNVYRISCGSGIIGLLFEVYNFTTGLPLVHGTVIPRFIVILGTIHIVL